MSLKKVCKSELFELGFKYARNRLHILLYYSAVQAYTPTCLILLERPWSELCFGMKHVGFTSWEDV